MRVAPIAVALLLGFSACSSAGSSAGLPPGQAPLAVPAIATTLLAGQYKGSVTDSSRGKGSAVLQLSQGGSSAGGSLNQTFAGKTIRGVVALNVSSTSLDGNEVLLGSSPCTLSVTAKYDAKTAVISGSYSATSRCKGRSGTFELTEQCYYTTPSIVTDVDRPDTINVKPC
jgi:hypothetical protein